MLGLPLLLSVWGQHCLSLVWGSQGTLGTSGFCLRARLHPQGQAETCSGTVCSAHRAQVVTASPPCRRHPWLPAGGLLPAGPARGGPRPLAPLPLFPGRPQPSRGSFATKAALPWGYHAVPGGCQAGTHLRCQPSPWGRRLSVPRRVLRGLLCSRQSQERSKRYQGGTVRYDTEHPGCRRPQPHPLRHSTSWARPIFPCSPGAAVGRRPGSSPPQPWAAASPHHFLRQRPWRWRRGPAARVSPPAHPRLLRAPVGPSHSSAIFRVALSAQLSLRRWLLPHQCLSHRAAPAETPLPARPDPAVRWGPPE